MPRMILCLVLLMGALSPLTAQTPATPAPAAPPSASDTMLTLGPDVLTFPEIAQKLSVGGHKVTCSPALEQFAAYVYLKNRSWEKTSRLLEQGLQIQLTPGKGDPNHFTLEWDQDTRRREREGGEKTAVSLSCRSLEVGQFLHHTGLLFSGANDVAE